MTKTTLTSSREASSRSVDEFLKLEVSNGSKSTQVATQNPEIMLQISGFPLSGFPLSGFPLSGFYVELLFLFYFLLEHIREMKATGLAIPRMWRGDLRLTGWAFLEQLAAIVDAERFFGLDGNGPRAARADSV
jgi:hypothetical protein